MTLIPTQITFRGLAHLDDLEAEVRERIDWLEPFYPGIVRCHVLLEVPHRHRRRGRHFHVRIDLTVPGRRPIVVSHDPSLHATLKDVEDAAAHKDTEVDNVYRSGSVAVRQAFDGARRVLEDVAREQRHAVKTHDVPASPRRRRLAGPTIELPTTR
jgi:Sigma 54 modulation protein / S30EA ribosomal protein